MRRRTQIAAAGATAVLALGLGTGAVMAGGNGDDGEGSPITGDARAQAEKAALDAVGEGTVTGTEVGDEESTYEVEVTRADGTQVDVQLDEDFTVVGQEDDGAEGSEGSERDEGDEG